MGGAEPLPIDSPLMQRLESIAKKHRTYIVNSMFRRGDGRDFNSAILIDREGQVAGIYDKAFPFWAELEKNENLDVGADVPVFETDFGKLGIAICFDVNFPELWRRLADRDAELVVWPSHTVRARHCKPTQLTITSTLLRPPGTATAWCTTSPASNW